MSLWCARALKRKLAEGLDSGFGGKKGIVYILIYPLSRWLCAPLKDQTVSQRLLPSDLLIVNAISFQSSLTCALTCQFHYRCLQSTCAWHLSSPLHQRAFFAVSFSTSPTSITAHTAETYSLNQGPFPGTFTGKCYRSPIC